MSYPTDAEKLVVIAAFGRKIIAQEQDATVKVQERLDTTFWTKYRALEAKYPEIVSALDGHQLQSLERAARRWISKQLITGAGKDF